MGSSHHTLHGNPFGRSNSNSFLATRNETLLAKFTQSVYIVHVDQKQESFLHD